MQGVSEEFSGKTAVVCGSTQGIGKATAMELAQRGASVVLIARDKNSLEKVLSQLPRNQYQQHSYLTADFSQPEELKRGLRHFSSLLQHVHILVNNSGGPSAGPAFFAEAETYISAFNQHLICNQYLVQAFVPFMKAAGFGRIINILSISVKRPVSDLGVSNTIRAAVANWARTLAIELGPFGITVNNILPGYTLTQRLITIIEHKAAILKLSPEELSEKMQKEIPLKRFALPEEIAKAVVFLASTDASYINGIDLPVDGGKSMAG